MSNEVSKSYKKFSDKEIDGLVRRLGKEIDLQSISNEVQKTFRPPFQVHIDCRVGNLEDIPNFSPEYKTCVTYVSKLEKFLLGTKDSVFIPAHLLNLLIEKPYLKHLIPNMIKHEIIHGFLDRGDRWLDAVIRNLKERKIELIPLSKEISSKNFISEGIAYALSESENSNMIPNEYKVIQGRVSNLAKDIDWDQVYRLYTGSDPDSLMYTLSKY